MNESSDSPPPMRPCCQAASSPAEWANPPAGKPESDNWVMSHSETGRAPPCCCSCSYCNTRSAASCAGTTRDFCKCTGCSCGKSAKTGPRHRHGSCSAKLVLGSWDNSARITLTALVLSLSGLGCAAGSSRDAMIDSAARPRCAEHSMAVNRAEAALQRFRFAYQGPACVRVLDSQKPAAYSWADGTICLTTGLIRFARR